MTRKPLSLLTSRLIEDSPNKTTRNLLSCISSIEARASKSLPSLAINSRGKNQEPTLKLKSTQPIHTVLISKCSQKLTVTEKMLTKSTNICAQIVNFTTKVRKKQKRFNGTLSNSWLTLREKLSKCMDHVLNPTRLLTTSRPYSE